MKKFLFIIIVASIFSHLVQAQKISIIPKAGATLSTVVFDDPDVTDDTGLEAGFTAGVGVNMPLGKGLFSIQPELNFIQKGWYYSNSTATFSGWVENTTLNYLEIPVLVKASFGKNKTRFYVNAGPSFALGLGGNQSVNSETIDVKFGKGDSDDDVLYIDNKLDVSLQAGFGVIIGGIIMIDARYGYGLTNIYDKSDDIENATSKNRVIQFTLGVPINLGR